MKKYIFLFLATGLFFSSCELPFGDVNECSQLCDDFMATDEANNTAFSSHGDCVSMCATCSNPSESAGKQAVCICNIYEAVLVAEGADWDDLGVKNKGECIKIIKGAINGDDITIIGN